MNVHYNYNQIQGCTNHDFSNTLFWNIHDHALFAITKTTILYQTKHKMAAIDGGPEWTNLSGKLLRHSAGGKRDVLLIVPNYDLCGAQETSH